MTSPRATKAFTAGTHRTCTPNETLARLHPHLESFGITRIANVTGLDRTGIPVVMVCRPNARSLAVSQGKGLTLAAAKASGVMEAVELWHAERISNPLRLASFAELRREHRVADPARLPLAAGSRYTPDLAMLWIEGEDLMGGGRVWVPLELVSANYTLPLPPGSGAFQANTNGLASGNHPLEAIGHGLCEVVERDAGTLWKLQSDALRAGRAIDPETISDADCRSVRDRLRGAGLSVRTWDTTSDIGIASFHCLVMEEDGDFADPEFGGGCHPVREVALLRALTEAAQARNTYISGTRDDYPASAWEAASRHRRAAFCRRLLAGPPARADFEKVPTFVSGSLDADVAWVLARLRTAGIEQAIAVDLTKTAVGVPVWRIIVPGLEGYMDEPDGDYAPGPRARRAMGALA